MARRARYNNGEPPAAPYRSPLHGQSRRQEQKPLRTHQWLPRVPASRALQFRVEVRAPRHRYFHEVYKSDNVDRALAHAIKLTRSMPKAMIRVWDFHKIKEVWTGKGPKAKITRWRTKPPPGLVGYEVFMNKFARANPRLRRGYRRNLHTAEERGLLDMDIAAMKGRFRGAVAGGRLEEARRIAGWFEGLAAAAAASATPSFYLKRLQATARKLERQIPEHPPQRRREEPPEAFLNPRLKVPRGQIEWLMGRIHVSTPDAEVEADILERTKKWPKGAQRQAVKIALKAHHKNRELFRRYKFNAGPYILEHMSRDMGTDWIRFGSYPTEAKANEAAKGLLRQGHDGWMPPDYTVRVRRNGRNVFKMTLAEAHKRKLVPTKRPREPLFNARRNACSNPGHKHGGTMDNPCGHAGLSGLMNKREAKRTMSFAAPTRNPAKRRKKRRTSR